MGRLVIMILVDVANGKQRHVPYRDSKLTYLLQVIIIYCSHKSARGKYLV
jgi:kinesin family protein 15